MNPADLLLYFQQRDSATQTFCAAKEICFKGETLEDLQIQVANITGIPISDIALFKYNPFSHSWQFLPDPAANMKHPSTIQLRNKPYNFRDGDLLIIKLQSQSCDDFEKHEPPKLPLQVMKKNVSRTEATSTLTRSTHSSNPEPVLSIQLEL